MAIVNKNQMVGTRGGAIRNEFCNGGSEYKKLTDADGNVTYEYHNTCLRKHNASNCGAMWKTKCHPKRQVDFAIRRKLPGGGKVRITHGG